MSPGSLSITSSTSENLDEENLVRQRSSLKRLDVQIAWKSERLLCGRRLVRSVKKGRMLRDRIGNLCCRWAKRATRDSGVNHIGSPGTQYYPCTSYILLGQIWRPTDRESREGNFGSTKETQLQRADRGLPRRFGQVNKTELVKPLWYCLKWARRFQIDHQHILRTTTIGAST